MTGSAVPPIAASAWIAAGPRPPGLASKLQAMAEVEVRGPHALRLRTARPSPGLVGDLAKVPVLRRNATLALTRDLLATHDPAQSQGVSNDGRYGNAALDRVLQEGLTSFDPAPQARVRRKAARLVAEDGPLILLYHPVNIWAARAPVTYAARLDGQSPLLGARIEAGASPPGELCDARR